MNRKIFFTFIFFVTLLFLFQTNSKTVFAKNQFDKNEIVLLNENENIKLDLSKFEHSSNIHTIIWDASLFARQRTNTQKAKKILSFFEATKNIENSFEMVMPGIKNKVDEIEKKVNAESINAKLILKNKKFEIVEGKNAKIFDREGLYFEILSFLKNSQQNKITIPTKFEKPKITKNDLTDCTNLRASFQTDFSKSSSERKNNIRKAIASFNGLNIYPGETISFNKTTGPRNAKNGYQEAKIILGGEYVAGYGGGVCQASTTIYNACIKAGLTCTGRGHSIPPSYISKGLDAMVSSGSSDMTITNNLDKTFFIESYCTNEKIIVNIYGEKMNNTEYKTKVVVNETLPNKGYKKIIDTKKEYTDKVFYTDESFIKQQATNGYKTTTYLQVFQNGKMISEKVLRKDYYPASEGIIIYGSETRPILQDDENFNIFDFIT